MKLSSQKITVLLFTFFTGVLSTFVFSVVFHYIPVQWRVAFCGALLTWSIFMFFQGAEFARRKVTALYLAIIDETVRRIQAEFDNSGNLPEKPIVDATQLPDLPQQKDERKSS